MSEKLTTKDRKKAFNTIFNQRIVPFFKAHGFDRHTKTSKRLYKDLGNGLSVFLFLEYKTFGYGFYDMNIVYFDQDIGDVYDDEYLTMAQIRIPTLQGDTLDALNIATDLWLDEVQSKIIPFIKAHSTHKAILNAEQFYYSKSREEECKALMRRKSED